MEAAYRAHRVAISTSVQQELTTVMRTRLAPTPTETGRAPATMDMQAMVALGIVQHQTALAAAVVPREQFNAFMARSGGKQAAARARAILDIQVLTVVQTSMSVLKDLIIVTTTQLAPTHWEASPAPATADIETTTIIMEAAYRAHRVAISTNVQQDMTTAIRTQLAPTHQEASPAPATLDI